MHSGRESGRVFAGGFVPWPDAMRVAQDTSPARIRTRMSAEYAPSNEPGQIPSAICYGLGKRFNPANPQSPAPSGSGTLSLAHSLLRARCWRLAGVG